jgi:hypothetical protein
MNQRPTREFWKKLTADYYPCSERARKREKVDRERSAALQTGQTAIASAPVRAPTDPQQPVGAASGLQAVERDAAPYSSAWDDDGGGGDWGGDDTGFDADIEQDHGEPAGVLSRPLIPALGQLLDALPRRRLNHEQARAQKKVHRYSELFNNYSKRKEELKQLFVERAGLEAAALALDAKEGAAHPMAASQPSASMLQGIRQAMAQGSLAQRASAVALVSCCESCGAPFCGSSVEPSGTGDVLVVSLSMQAARQQRLALRCGSCQHKQALHPITLGCFPSNPETATEGQSGTWFDEDVLAAGRALRRHGHYPATAFTHVVQDVQAFRGGSGSLGRAKYVDLRELTLVSSPRSNHSRAISEKRSHCFCVVSHNL